ncbi:MAG: hypothetical protein K9I68_01535 [Bacteroidales bacterium]|nr:hypothetical protein [Bacteroidales bacterium]MCF8337069.1 hypothetical protein [Bacteroidales bacterium]
MIKKTAMHVKLTVVIVFILLVAGYVCNNSSQRSQAIQKKVKQYHDKKILLPFSDSVLYNNAVVSFGNNPRNQKIYLSKTKNTSHA